MQGNAHFEVEAYDDSGRNLIEILENKVMRQVQNAIGLELKSIILGKIAETKLTEGETWFEQIDEIFEKRLSRRVVEIAQREVHSLWESKEAAFKSSLVNQVKAEVLNALFSRLRNLGD